ncbi:MAG: endonuclease/exonuclease/phosphatase family protein [Gemmatimonadota bacterium]|uniref:endonuclease/exonuclease/phosphatase family protein n=1 Tax=Candidatus Palauibacter scopulicola TaxID=3056741 RepID=UPI00238FC370|nr:endonuclease/exonuclease/phosphatase family protein [Candidatus Palauibacter scopulicola]MDE2664400.1 endonuclease/exonuclease/phosphatase family protein [Candidatus Palauibacter scopulicola]
MCWNIAGRKAPWRELFAMGADVALLQEARKPPPDVAPEVELGGAPWLEHQFDRWCRVVRLSDRVRVEHFTQIDPISMAKPGEMPVSGIGTSAAARVIPQDGEPFIAVSMYARWMGPLPTVPTKWRVGFADGSAHRAISDLSAFIGHEDPGTHRILVAGDLNMNPDVRPQDEYWIHRSRTVWTRMEALGLDCLGPHDGPTYHTTRGSPENPSIQLDYVFASRGFSDSITARALNKPEEWGSSDHCRLLIEVSP